MELNLSTLAKHFSDEEAAWELVEHLRWPMGPVCPHCGDTGRAYFLSPKNGYRTTSTGRVSYRRVWKCKACRKQFSVLVGTIFERSQVPLSKWLLALHMMSANKNGVAANELRRTIGVTQPTAWFMLHRLREAMRLSSLHSMRGTIVADETFWGGKAKFMHADKRATAPAKVPVLALINADTGEVRTQAVANVDGTTLAKVISEQVDVGSSILWTDEGTQYIQLGKQFLAHETVSHAQGVYVNKHGAGTNRAEGFFGQLRRSVDGTHHHISREHLHRYLGEFAFRYSTCKISDTERLERIIAQAEGRRLTYRRVTAA